MEKQLKNSKFYPWFICFIAIIVAYSAIGTCSSSFGTHLPYFLEEFQLSKTLSSTINSFKTFGGLIALVLVAPFLRKLKIKYVMMAGMTIALAGWIILANATGYTMLCMGAVCLGVCYTVCGMTAITAIARNWFNVHRGLAVGLVTSASGLASTINPQIIKAVAAKSGIFSACYIGAGLMVLCIVLIFFFISDDPAEKGYTPLGGTTAAVTSDGKLKATQGESQYAPTKLAYVLLALFAFLLGGFNQAAWTNLSMLYTTAGWVKADMANLLTIGGFLLMAFKIVFGLISDKFSAKKTAWFFFLACVLAHLGWWQLAGIQNWWVQFAVFFMYTLGGMLATTGIAVYVMDFTTPETCKTLAATMMIVNQCGSLVTSPIMGRIADVTGSYQPAYLMLAAFGVAGYVCTMIAYKLAEANKKKLSANRTEPAK